MPTHASTCAVCQAAGKYRCPRCSVFTCSMACSTSHKSSTGCSGERDRAQYVPLTDYGAGTLLDDYRYLEAVSRKVSEWGKGIADPKLGGSRAGRGNGRGRGDGPRQDGRRAPLPPAMAQLQRAAADRGFEIAFLSEGMQRRLANKSHYQTLFLDVTFVLRLSAGWQTPTSDLPKVSSHKNAGSETLLDILQARSNSQMPTPTRTELKTALAAPQTLAFILRVPAILSLPDVSPSEPSTSRSVQPGVLVDRSRSSAATRPVAVWRLQGDVPLMEALRGCGCVEWPVIEVWNALALDRAIREGRLDVRTRQTIERAAPIMPGVKRKRGEEPVGLVDYGSDDDEEDDAAALAIADAATDDLTALSTV